MPEAISEEHQKCTRTFTFRSTIPLSEPKNVEYIFLVETILSFFSSRNSQWLRRVSNAILKGKSGTVRSEGPTRLLLKSAERTREFYRRNIVKWFSSMPHNSSIFNIGGSSGIIWVLIFMIPVVFASMIHDSRRPFITYWLNDFPSGNLVSFCSVSLVFKLLFYTDSVSPFVLSRYGVFL